MKLALKLVILLCLTGIAAQALPLNAQRVEKGDPRLEALARFAGKAVGLQVLTHVTLIDGIEDTAKPDMAVVIKDERIESILPMAALASRDDLKAAKLIDLKGQFLIPGLIDTHVHLATLAHFDIPAQHLRRKIFSGITGVRDMAGDARSLANLARASLVNEIPAPDIYYSALMAGPSFFQDIRTASSSLGLPPGSQPWLRAIDDTTDIRLAVAEAKGSFAAGIKIYADLEARFIGRVIAEAKRQNFPVWSHLQVPPSTPLDIITAEPQSVSHICMLAEYIARKDKQEYSKARPDVSGVMPDNADISSYLMAIKKAGTVIDATLLVYPEKGTPRDTGKGCNRPKAGSLLQPFVRAGIPISTGTDATADPDNPFPALMDEFGALAHHAGMTPAQVLKAATINGAKAMGQEASFGSIEIGKLANFAVLRDSPLIDVTAYRSVIMTMKRGVPFWRKDYTHTTIPPLPFPRL